ncbi:aspartyl-tRNA(Asn)/glutamyl-tRNA(Gln) amidotransferase subunit A [Arcanobacterium pluranimalium]|uniref:Asp-tRNA(Asn)/Glu-tRNA(Gln) amidotransferase subunit GatA n=1 Tax=Arcanobacterium pluranimalium TaxID=108028 RepID=UPI00195945C5|nr:Asp-tRNA(Asn)/Glu-tRNA(Gln) amidotransferase subunit GatA [Arcanobacterium pluranimalium]MBM7825761.1 aspartyl-tRNA(Asn)/glutamyl-tRNA(Gln) amidotransferase subunit A [Arcanobacterium pluranimalium]
MNEILKKSALELAQMLRNREITSVELTQLCLDAIERLDSRLHAFLYVDREGALQQAQEVDDDRAAGRELPQFAGVPVAVKDNMCQRGIPTTCGSLMLEGWKPPYDATVITKLKQARLPIIGHTNMDEFAMGSSTEHSAFGSTRNPWDIERIPGGSGGGSAAAVAAYLVPWALGSDTGGSIRQPGAVTGTVGAKPTYGAVSRYGLVAMASSLDQIGPVTRTVEDAAALQDIIDGYDPHDSTSLPDSSVDLLEAARELNDAQDLSGLRIGLVEQMQGEGYSQGVLDVFNATVEHLREHGAQIVTVSCPSFEYSLGAYYLIMPAEVSSNLARFDGVRYGNRVEPKEGPVTAETMMSATRGAKFGTEVKRRVILGTHALSAGYFDAYYGSAQRVRTLVQRDLDAAFAQCDVLISPTSPTVAFRFGEKSNDPMAMYMNDIATIPANLAGVPAMSVPAGLSEGLPVGVQVIAPAHEDARMYKFAAVIESLATDDATQCPVEALEEAL